MVDKVEKEEKTEKITDKDWKVIEAYLKSEFDKRKTAKVRVDAENKWREVDRQIEMLPLDKSPRNPNTMEDSIDEDWHSALELGELAQAAHDITSEVIRIVYPNNRAWFDAHVKVAPIIDVNTGQESQDIKAQSTANKRLRAMMQGQHKDFGLKDRTRLSIKEALHHGGFVWEVREESAEMIYDGGRVKKFTAPVPVPHSMYNCYPDHSPSVFGTNMYYTGSMFVKQYMPGYKVKDMAQGDGWMPSQIKRVKKQEHVVKDVKTPDWELLYYWGDILIKRGDKDSIFLPNYKAILANGTIIYLKENDTPYIPIIYQTWERTDVRNPYGTSPIIKMSPIHKLASIMTNKFVDSAYLAVEPPIVYDANDPQFVADGGPRIAPGAMSGTKSMGSFKEIQIGTPEVPLKGVEFAISHIRHVVGGNSLDPAATQRSRATASEILKIDQDEEIGLVDFIDGMESALRTYLYMQHHLNRADSKFIYTFYNPELGAVDFDIMKSSDLPDDVHFDVSGARGVLGETMRAQRFTAVMAQVAGNQMLSQMIDWKMALKTILHDSGIKSPEEYMVQEDSIPPQVKMQIQQMQQAIQQLAGKLKDSESQNQVKMQKAGMDHVAKMAKIKAGMQQELAAIQADMQKTIIALKSKSAEGDKDRELEAARIALDDMHKRHDRLMQLAMTPEFQYHDPEKEKRYQEWKSAATKRSA